jgi:hypothetical protein
MFVSEKGKGVMALGSIDVDECMTMDVFFSGALFSLLCALKKVQGGMGQGALLFWVMLMLTKVQVCF